MATASRFVAQLRSPATIGMDGDTSHRLLGSAVATAAKKVRCQHCTDRKVVAGASLNDAAARPANLPHTTPSSQGIRMV